LKRVKVGVLQHKSKPNRLARELAHVGPGLPRHDAFEFIAELFVAVGEPDAGNGVAIGVLNLDLQ